MSGRRCRSNDTWIRLSTATVRTVIAVVALLAGCMTAAGAATRRSSLVIAQAQSTPSAPGAPARMPDRTIGLPRPKNYEAIPELRDIYFDFGKADVRPDDVNILEANTAWLRAHPSYLVLIEGHSDNRGHSHL